MIEPNAEEAEFLDWLQEQGYGAGLIMPDGMWCAIRPLMFHWTMHIGVVGDKTGYEDRYCYADFGRALMALVEWSERDFQGEPTGWRRHPKSGRRRNDAGDHASESVDP